MNSQFCGCCSPGLSLLIQRRKDFARVSQELALHTSGKGAGAYQTIKETLSSAMEQLNDAVCNGEPLACIDVVIDLGGQLRERRSAAAADENSNGDDLTILDHLVGIAEALILACEAVAESQQQGLYLKPSGRTLHSAASIITHDSEDRI